MANPEKPEDKQALILLHSLLDDLQESNGAKNTKRDKAVAEARYLEEGMGFLTKTLPKLGSALDAGLRTGLFVCPTNFHRWKQTALPAFLHGLLRKIFDSKGNILPIGKIDVAAIAEARQVLFVFYKLKRPFTAKQEKAAEDKFKEVDSLLQFEISNLAPHVRDTVNLAKELLKSLFEGFNPEAFNPVHGPGIVASGEKPHEKRIFSTKYNNIHAVYPYYRWFYVNSHHLLHTVRHYWQRHVADAGINKVLFVPKDSRGPRTIACEPLEYQFLQGGLRRALYDHIEKHPLTRGKVNFTDQSINQSLAYQASIDGKLATLDLKDASDSVSNDLVLYLFSETGISNRLQALRTPSSRLPSGEIVSLKKYAAMGSALCFPVEALVFWSLAQAAEIRRSCEVPLVFVYGDDIVCRCEAVDDIITVFKSVSLTVNVDKSSFSGFFRESCGKDYYNGWDISYLKIRDLEVSSLHGTASLVESSNLMAERFYHKTAAEIRRFLRKNGRIIPWGYRNSEYLCYYTDRFHIPLDYSKARYNKKLQRYERFVPVLSGTSYSNQATTTESWYGEYFRKLTQGWAEFFRASSYVKRKLKMLRKPVLIGT
jgi:hypothetical protein